MSRSPERMSSYRRHFEGALSASSSLQVRVSSPSPTRRDNRTRSASFNRSGTMGRRAVSGSRRAHMTGGASMGTLCVGMGLMDLDTAVADNQAFLSTRTSERQEMITLNDRLAKYIEKVRTLESQNKLLEAEIDALQNRYTKPSGLRMLYEEQLREMKRVADQMRAQRDLSFAAKDAMAGQLEMFRVKYEEAVEARKKAEMDIEAFRPDVDAATAGRIALEKQLDNLQRDLEFIQRVHKQEIEELMAQIYSGMSTVDVAYSLPDLGSALKDIQAQYDSIAAKNLQEMDAWYKDKFQDMNSSTSRHVQSVRGVRQEITGVKKDIQNKERELEALKTRNEALEAQIREAQLRHKKEEEDLLAKIEALKLELRSIKTKIATMLKEYQDLLNIKMALEIEITTYRKLIEGEDSRLNTMVRGMSLMSSGMSGSMGAGMGGSGMSGGVMNGSAMSAAMGTMSASGKSASAMSASMGTDVAGGMGASMSAAMSASAAGFSSNGGGSAMEMASKTMSSSNGKSTMVSSSNGMSKTVSSSGGLMSMSASSEFSEEQAVEMTERKTVLIRTVRTDEDVLQSDTQERTFKISGAADDL